MSCCNKKPMSPELKIVRAICIAPILMVIVLNLLAIANQYAVYRMQVEMYKAQAQQQLKLFHGRGYQGRQ